MSSEYYCFITIVVIVEDKDRDQLGSGDDNHTQSGSEGTSQSESQIEYGGRSDCDGGTAHPDSEPQHSSGFVSGMNAHYWHVVYMNVQMLIVFRF